MEINNNVSLKKLNTFGVEASTAFLAKLHNKDDITELLEWKLKQGLPNLLLGGGSNLLFKNDYQGLIAKVCLLGKHVVDQDNDYTYVTAAGGENWHEFVRWTINLGLAGLENLSLIPGNVGAAPIQNIGAYGVELSDYFYSLEVMDLSDGSVRTFDKDACQFGYRESYFKAVGLDKLLITSVTFRLPKKPKWKIGYAGVRDVLEGKELTAERISDAVIQLRRSKLPDPTQIGNAGSFFKNPLLDMTKWETIKSDFEDFPGYKQSNVDQGNLDRLSKEQTSMKTSAAWLIDQCGWKGFRDGDAGVSENHALVLVNYGQATGSQLWTVAENIMTSVEEKFGIRLEPEPRVIGG